jgi:hypothetical protein
MLRPYYISILPSTESLQLATLAFGRPAKARQAEGRWREKVQAFFSRRWRWGEIFIKQLGLGSGAASFRESKDL